MRVCGVSAARMSSADSSNCSSSNTVTIRPPRAVVQISYMSKAGATPTASGTPSA